MPDRGLYGHAGIHSPIPRIINSHRSDRRLLARDMLGSGGSLPSRRGLLYRICLGETYSDAKSSRMYGDACRLSVRGSCVHAGISPLTINPQVEL